nr:hypothetical protein [Sphingobium yanoikuyae]
MIRLSIVKIVVAFYPIRLGFHGVPACANRDLFRRQIAMQAFQPRLGSVGYCPDKAGALQRATGRARRVLHRFDLKRIGAGLDHDRIDYRQPHHASAFEPVMAGNQGPGSVSTRATGTHDDGHDLTVFRHQLTQCLGFVGMEGAQSLADQDFARG